MYKIYRMGQGEIDAVSRVLSSRFLFKVNGGPYQECMNFEEELRQKFDVKNAVYVTSGKAALISALVGMGIGPGDQVIVPAYTYIATAMAVVAVGAIPVIAEVDDTLTIDPVDVEKKITPATKAIFPVHIHGFPCNMDAICAIAKKHNLMVLEDACQADGGSYKGKRLGTIGDAGALSFNAFKIISAGEGGALLTNNDKIFHGAHIYQDASGIAFFGDQLAQNDIEPFCGVEYRTNEVGAAIMREQLKGMDDLLADLRRTKKAIMDGLSDTFEFAPSNDPDGDCGITVALKFDDAKKAREFSEKIYGEGVMGELPIDTGKHVYSNWTPIINKRGALNPLMDPFKMEANKDIIPDYSVDMCPKSLDILSKNVYVSSRAQFTDDDIKRIIETCKKYA